MATEVAGWRGGWINRLVAKPGFQRWASDFPLTRGRARRDGAALFEVVQGFVKSQVLMALVELDVFRRLRAGPMTADTLGHALDLPSDRMQILLQAGAAMGLLRRKRGNRFGLARQGAALMGVPGLEAMIRHHRAFYRDLEDPVALLRGPDRTELSEFWPYVFGARGDVAPDVARTYSDLMAQSQLLVAQDTLRTINLKGVTRLLDIGGGTGAFLEAVGTAYPNLDMVLFDLPQVVPEANDRFAKAGMADRVRIEAGSFRDDALPEGADAISLIRVLYDHADSTVQALLEKVYDALPAGGRLVISEPMGGGAKPEASGDVYFALYTMAMQTGRARSADEISELCRAVGFENVQSAAPRRAYVTRVLTAVKPS